MIRLNRLQTNHVFRGLEDMYFPNFFQLLEHVLPTFLCTISGDGKTVTKVSEFIDFSLTCFMIIPRLHNKETRS